MTNTKNHKTEPELWFESQKEAIRALRPDHKVDVVEAVMKQIASMPVSKTVPLIGRRRVVQWAAAACVAAVVVSTAFFLRPDAVAANVQSAEIAASLMDVYGYCNDYEGCDDEAAYYENPVAYMF